MARLSREDGWALSPLPLSLSEPQRSHQHRYTDPTTEGAYRSRLEHYGTDHLATYLPPPPSQGLLHIPIHRLTLQGVALVIAFLAPKYPVDLTPPEQ